MEKSTLETLASTTNCRGFLGIINISWDDNHLLDEVINMNGS